MTRLDKFYRNILLLMAMALLTAACGSKKDFSITLKINDDVERMAVMTYNTSRGVKRVTGPMVKGQLKLTGESADYTAAMLAWSDGEPIAKCIVRNGDHLKLTIDPKAVMPEVKGNAPTEQLFDFIADNAATIASGDTAALNRAVAAFVVEHRKSPAALQVMIDYLNLRDNEAAADTLLELIDPAARPAPLLQNYGVVASRQLAANKPERIYPFGVFTARADSIERILPGAKRLTLLAFLSSARQPRRQQVDDLKQLDARADSLRLRIVELSTAGDSAAWRLMIRADGGPGWVQGWMPAATSSSAMKRMAVPREPFYILIDSTGSQLYRGDSFAAAVDCISRHD